MINATHDTCVLNISFMLYYTVFYVFNYRSVLYLFDNSTLDMTPIDLPAKIKIRQVSVVD